MPKSVNKTYFDILKLSHCNFVTPLQCFFFISVYHDSVDYISTARLSSISFNNVVILKILKSLNVNKAHGHDDISVRMMKLYGQSIVKPMAIVFKNCFDNSIFF